jgi:hypothetical protein
MVQRIEGASAAGSFTFVVVGDSGAWYDPTAEAIFSTLVAQVGALDPPPIFFANLGDFAGPGTAERHEDYLRLVEGLDVPNLCVVGNHDLDDPDGWWAFESFHGPVNFEFAHGHTRFVALHAAPGIVGQVDVPGEGTAEGIAGPRDEDLAFLDEALGRAQEPYRIVLMHMPPYLEGHYAPHADWGFRPREADFLALLRQHRVSLVCCAHGLAFDTVVADGIRFVMSGGGGTGLCSHYRGVCTAGEGRPEDRGALFHAVEVSVGPSGEISGRVLQAFDGPTSARIVF